MGMLYPSLVGISWCIKKGWGKWVSLCVCFSSIRCFNTGGWATRRTSSRLFQKVLFCRWRLMGNWPACTVAIKVVCVCVHACVYVMHEVTVFRAVIVCISGKVVYWMARNIKMDNAQVRCDDWLVLAVMSSCEDVHMMFMSGLRLDRGSASSSQLFLLLKWTWESAELTWCDDYRTRMIVLQLLDTEAELL